MLEDSCITSLGSLRGSLHGCSTRLVQTVQQAVKPAQPSQGVIQEPVRLIWQLQAV